MKYESILHTIGRTPIIKLSKLAPPHVSLYAKVESFNPMGSVKDRLALAVIERGEQSGALRPGQTVIEATSGNTGIGLAMVCAAKNYPLVIVMAENFSIERRRLMRFLGAKVVLTPASQKGSGMLAKAVELAEAHGWFLTRQFENEANADVHSATTAREILDDFEGERLDYWVSAFGTGGTLKGVSRALRSERPEIKIAVVEPDNSAMLASGVAQPQSANGFVVSHPHFRPHPIQGTSPDFIPKLAGDALAAGLIDEIVPVNGAEALHFARALAVREGVFAGISSGASLAAALRIAETAPTGAAILCMLADTGERYLSTPLFEEVPVDMTVEEAQISRSTALCRFDAPTPVAPAPKPAEPVVDAEAASFTAQAIADGQVVMFALEWCEFCWAVRRLLAALSVPYRSIDLDSVALQKGDLGGRIRVALQARTETATIPQVFIGGAYFGGCAELFEAARTGALHERLRAAGVSFDADARPDLAAALPQWLAQAR
jgi:cysteine synthase